MKELSIFVDESGDFGEYQLHSPYYIITLVFHDQSVDISKNIQKFRDTISRRDIPEYVVHSAPLIRRESDYKNLDFSERKIIFDSLFHFVRLTDITYHSIIVEKKNLVEELDLHIQIAKQFSRLLKGNIEMFMQYERIIVYYDYGQLELTNILLSTFHSILNNVELRKVTPADYILLQAADMLCTLDLLSLKEEKKMLSKSELSFFANGRNLRKTYLKAIQAKKFKST